jgi:mRNA interferase MazF
MRPLLIISGNLLNAYLNVVICCPLTTKIKNYKGNVILNPDNNNNLSETSEVLTFHVRSVSKSRLVKKIGNVSKEELKLVKKCLDEILTY